MNTLTIFSSENLFLVTTIFIRILLSASLGAIIGIDRVKKRRPAGIKTHALVSMGATLVMLTSEFIYLNFDGSTDVARLAAQVISGVGFLGAGTIMVTGKNQVKGLTTAAGLWFSATLGLAIGIGFYAGATSSMIVLFVITRIFSIYDLHLQKNSFVIEMYVELDSKTSLGSLLKIIRQYHCHISDIEKIDSHSSSCQLFHMSVTLHKQISRKELIQKISQITGVTYIDEV